MHASSERAGEGQSVSANAFVPLAFELGEAFQFDWSEEGLVVGGIYYRMQVSHLKLCASRAFWLVAYPSQGHEMLFDAHTRSFAAMGGIARRGIYDNMKTAVDKVKKGKGRTVNKRFAVMCAHYLFDADFCNVASGWEKGVVEKNVQDSRRRIWIEAGQQRFGSFVELNAWLGDRCRALWDEVEVEDAECKSRWTPRRARGMVFGRRSSPGVLKDRMTIVKLIRAASIAAAMLGSAGLMAATLPSNAESDSATRPEPRAKSCPGGCGRTTLRGATDGEPRAKSSLAVPSDRSRTRVDRQQPACPGGCSKGARASDDTERSSRTRASPLTPALAKTGHATGQTCPGGCGKAGRHNGGAVMR